MEMQLTKFSAAGADVVGKTMKYFSAEFASLFCGEGSQDAPAEGSNYHHPQMQCPHEFKRKVHNKMDLFAHMVLSYSPNYRRATACDFHSE